MPRFLTFFSFSVALIALLGPARAADPVRDLSDVEDRRQRWELRDLTPLLEAARSENRDLQSAAIAGLGRSALDARAEIREAEARLSNKKLFFLEPDWSKRAAKARTDLQDALGEIRNRYVLTKDWNVRQICLDAWIRSADADGIREAASVLGGTDASARRTALRALGSLDFDRDVEPSQRSPLVAAHLALLGSPVFPEAVYAARNLTRLVGSAEAAPRIREAAKKVGAPELARMLTDAAGDAR